MKKFWKKNKGFFAGFGLGLMLFLGFVVGISMAIDTSIVNQLQQYTQTTRTNDMFHPIIISSNEGIMEIELTLPTLNMIDNDFDMSDIWVRFGRIENPIISILDWVDRGQYLDELYFVGDVYDAYCDNPDPTDTYYTHFYYMWNTGMTLAEGFTYVLIVDFYDGDGEFWMCEDLWSLLDWFEGEEGPLTIIRPTRPTIEGMTINVDPDFPEEEEIQDLLLNCDYVSFFEYQEPEITDEAPPTTPGDTETGDNGAEAGGWLNDYDIFSNIQNGIALLIFILILGLLGLIIFILLFMKKKKEEDKKKDGKKKGK